MIIWEAAAKRLEKRVERIEIKNNLLSNYSGKVLM